MLLKNLKVQKTNDKPVRLLADKFQLTKSKQKNVLDMFGFLGIWILKFKFY